MNNTKSRKVKQSKYGEDTVVVRVPKSMLPAVKEMLNKREILETQWQSSQLPPKAQQLLELITDRMLFSQKALIENLRCSDKPEFRRAADDLDKDYREQRQVCLGSNVSALLTVLQDC